MPPHLAAPAETMLQASPSAPWAPVVATGVGQKRALDTPQPGLSQPQARQGGRDEHLPLPTGSQREVTRAAPRAASEVIPGMAEPRLTGQRPAPHQEPTGQAAGKQGRERWGRAPRGPVPARPALPHTGTRSGGWQQSHLGSSGGRCCL